MTILRPAKLLAAALVWLVGVVGVAIGLLVGLAHADNMEALIYAKTHKAPMIQGFQHRYAQADNIKSEHVELIYQAEIEASLAAKSVLQTVRQMALDDREVVQGACWDYLNTAFKRAGVERETLFAGKYPHGPFADIDTIQTGDWLYYVNHSYHDIEHSGLFIGWVDRAQRQALILSYGGENRREPARYRVYDITHTYNIMRPTL